jgi:hypothetical protein
MSLSFRVDDSGVVSCCADPCGQELMSSIAMYEHHASPGCHYLRNLCVSICWVYLSTRMIDLIFCWYSLFDSRRSGSTVAQGVRDWAMRHWWRRSLLLKEYQSLELGARGILSYLVLRSIESLHLTLRIWAPGRQLIVALYTCRIINKRSL